MSTDIISIGKGLNYPPREVREQVARNEAVAMWRASDPAGGQWLRDVTGNGHDARFGSIGSARVMGPINGKDGYFKVDNGVLSVERNESYPTNSGVYELYMDLQVNMESFTSRAIIAGPSSRYFSMLPDSLEIRVNIDGNVQVLSGPSFGAHHPGNNRFEARWVVSVEDNYFDSYINNGDGWVFLGRVEPGDLTTSLGSLTATIGGWSQGSFGSWTGRVYRFEFKHDGEVFFAGDYRNLEDGVEEFESLGYQTTVVAASGEDTNDPLHLDYDGEPYLYLPGFAGNYASTPDVNLLDADTAHVHQSRGLWNSSSGSVHSYSTEHSVIGDGSFRSERLDSGVGHEARMISPTFGIPVTAGTTYTFSAEIAAKDSYSMNIGIRFWADDGSILASGGSAGSGVVPGGYEWTRIHSTQVAPEGATRAGWTITQSTGGSAGDVFYVDAACFRQGNDPTFVLSHRIVGDVDLRVSLTRDNWAPSQREDVFYTYTSGTGYGAYLSGASFGMHYGIGDGTAKIAGFPINQELAPGTQNLRIVLQSSVGQIHLYWPDKDTLHSTMNTTSGVLGVNNRPITVGSNSFGSGQFFNGIINYAEVRDGIDGPVVARFEPENFEEPHITAPGGAGEEWTIHRSSSGRKSALVDRPILLFGTDDYLEVPHHNDLNLEDKLTAAIVFRTHNAPNAHQMLFNKYGSNVGWALQHSTTNNITAFLADGAIRTRGLPLGEHGLSSIATFQAERRDPGLIDFRMIVNQERSQDLVLSNMENVTNSLSVRIGRISNSTQFADMEFIGAAIFKGKALTDLELKWAAKELMK